MSVELARRVAEFRHPDIYISGAPEPGGDYLVTLSSKLIDYKVTVRGDGRMVTVMATTVGKVSDLDHIMHILSLAKGMVLNV